LRSGKWKVERFERGKKKEEREGVVRCFLLTGVVGVFIICAFGFYLFYLYAQVDFLGASAYKQLYGE
jgi:uncharacterized membrane protein